MANPNSTYEKEVAAMSHTLLARCTDDNDIGRLESNRAKKDGKEISTLVQKQIHDETVGHFQTMFEKHK